MTLKTAPLSRSVWFRVLADLLGLALLMPLLLLLLSLLSFGAPGTLICTVQLPQPAVLQLATIFPSLLCTDSVTEAPPQPGHKRITSPASASLSVGSATLLPLLLQVLVSLLLVLGLPELLSSLGSPLEVNIVLPSLAPVVDSDPCAELVAALLKP